MFTGLTQSGSYVQAVESSQKRQPTRLNGTGAVTLRPVSRTKKLRAKIRWLTLSGKLPMGLVVPPLKIEIMLESNHLKSRMTSVAVRGEGPWRYQRRCATLAVKESATHRTLRGFREKSDPQCSLSVAVTLGQSPLCPLGQSVAAALSGEFGNDNSQGNSAGPPHHPSAKHRSDLWPR